MHFAQEEEAHQQVLVHSSKAPNEQNRALHWLKTGQIKQKF
jgi:hypothetical protein